MTRTMHRKLVRLQNNAGPLLLALGLAVLLAGWLL